MRLTPVRPLLLALLSSTLLACDDGVTAPPTDSIACNTTVGTIDLSETVTGVLTPESCRFADGTRADRWRIVLDSAAIITIDMTSDDVDPFLMIRHADGTLIAQDDDGGGSPDARITIGLAAGTYYIVANTYYQDEYGGYTLAVE
jgi:hypothetical protein